jgi:hypothetical protein
VATPDTQRFSEVGGRRGRADHWPVRSVCCGLRVDQLSVAQISFRLLHEGPEEPRRSFDRVCFTCKWDLMLLDVRAKL